MTNRRFPVANTDRGDGTPLTVPWEVAERAAWGFRKRYGIPYWIPYCSAISLWNSRDVGESELDTWYGPHWREVAR